MNSSIQRACSERSRYIHVSKPLKKIKLKLGTIEIERLIVDPHKGVTRFTNKAAFERLGKNGKGVLHAAA